jgi:EAL and modified HD-GYP domain-containing signal transduction protein
VSAAGWFSQPGFCVLNVYRGCPVPIDATAQLSLPFDEFFLARQPILGRDQHLVAFELLFRTAGSTEANVTDDAAATAAVISHASQLGMEHVVGAQLAFVNVTEAALMSDYVRFLPADKVILEILETVKATPELVARVTELKLLGFKFALDDVVAESEDVRALVELVDVIKIDVKGVDPARLPALTAALRREHKKLLAERSRRWKNSACASSSASNTSRASISPVRPSSPAKKSRRPNWPSSTCSNW